MPKKIVKGFTIIELLVVLAVIGVFTSFAYPNISNWIKDREVKKATYDVVTFIKELKSEVNNGKYSMAFFHLNPNLAAHYMTTEDYTSTYKGFSNNEYKSKRFCTQPWKQKTLKYSTKQIGFQFYANDYNSSLTTYPSDQSFDRRVGALCITKKDAIQYIDPHNKSRATERDPDTGKTVDIFVICHRSVSPNQGDCRPDQTNDYRYKILIDTFKNTKIYKYNKSTNKWRKIDG